MTLPWAPPSIRIRAGWPLTLLTKVRRVDFASSIVKACSRSSFLRCRRGVLLLVLAGGVGGFGEGSGIETGEGTESWSWLWQGGAGLFIFSEVDLLEEKDSTKEITWLLRSRGIRRWALATEAWTSLSCCCLFPAGLRLALAWNQGWDPRRCC